MLFGNNVINQSVLASFNAFSIGTRIRVGINGGYWVGNLVGFERGIVVLNNAQLFANSGDLIRNNNPIARVPLNMVTCVNEVLEENPPKHDGDRGKGFTGNIFRKLAEIKRDLDASAERVANSLQRTNKSAQEFFNKLFEPSAVNPMNEIETENENNVVE